MLNKMDEPKELFQENGQWFHWDETWSYKHGPFPDLETARRALNVYCVCELDGVPEEKMAEAKRMRLYFPYRIVFLWYDDLDKKEWIVEAAYSKRRAMSLRRKGYGVFILEHK